MAGLNPRLQGRTKCLRIRTLEFSRDAEEEMLIGYSADELESNGQTGRSEAAGDGDGGNPSEIGGAIQAQKQCTSGVILFIHACSFFVKEWGCDRGSWNDKSVDASVRHHQVDLLDELVAQFESSQIGRC